jgi:hypothetical protein
MKINSGPKGGKLKQRDVKNTRASPRRTCWFAEVAHPPNLILSNAGMRKRRANSILTRKLAENVERLMVIAELGIVRSPLLTSTSRILTQMAHRNWASEKYGAESEAFNIPINYQRTPEPTEANDIEDEDFGDFTSASATSRTQNQHHISPSAIPALPSLPTSASKANKSLTAQEVLSGNRIITTDLS